MKQITLGMDGMMCGMCESHINDAIRNRFRVKKVTSSYKTGITEILSEEAPDEQQLKETISATGYKVLSVETAPYEKKGFSLFGK